VSCPGAGSPPPLCPLTRAHPDSGKDLDSTCFRLAIVAALRSKWAKGKVTGLMVTASHNPEQVRAAAGKAGGRERGLHEVHLRGSQIIAA